MRSAKFPAYQANITAYTASLLAHRCADTLLYEEIWNRQKISDELKGMLLVWARSVDQALRTTAGMKMPTEWAKRPDCWQAVSAIVISVPARSGIPELG